MQSAISKQLQFLWQLCNICITWGF